MVEGIPWLADWDPTNTLKTAVLALSYIGRSLGSAAIWFGVFSPLWIVVLVVIYVFRRRTGRYFWEARAESGVVSRTAQTASEVPSAE